MPTDKITIVIDADASDAIKDFTKLNKAQKNNSDGLKGLKIGYAAFAAVLTGTVAVALGKATKAAIDFEEANSKFATVFKDVRKSANDLRRDLVKNFGLSTKSATELLSATGDLLSGFGFTGKAALDLSGEVNKLAVDLASFTNAQGGAEAVSAALTKALLGERESLKTYGIAVQEADVQSKLLEKGQKDLTGEALRQAKAYATLEIAMSQSKNALGDFGRTSGSTANQIKQIKAVGEDLQIVFGSLIKDTIGPLITDFGKFIKTSDGIKTMDILLKSVALSIAAVGGVFKIAFASINAAIKPALVSLGGLFSALKSAVTGSFSEAFKTIKNIPKEANESILETGKALEDSLKNSADAMVKAYGVSMKKILDNNKATNDQINSNNANQIEKTKGLFAILADIYSKDREKLRGENDKKRFDIENFAEATKTLIGGAFDFVSQKRSQELDAALAANDSELNDKISKLEEQKEAGILSEEEFQEAKLQAEESAQQAETAIKKKAFEQEKKLRLVEIAINTAGAIMATFARLGFPAGLSGIAPITATAAVQAGLIGSQKFPGFASGTTEAPSGMALVGEQGPELINMSGGEEIIPASTTSNTINNTSNNNNSNVTVSIETNDPQQFVNRLKAQYGIDAFGA